MAEHDQQVALQDFLCGERPDKIMTAMSGGVDSSLSAALVRDTGIDCAGMFMKNWEEEDGQHCPAEADADDARRVAEHLGISLHTRNFAAEYWDDVFQGFLEEYRTGRTPNPDILCNREIKFKVFAEHAEDLGATHIATGHYAQKRIRDGVHWLCRGADNNKDQSYFLYAINQTQLRRALFPIGHLHKPDVRRMAEAIGIPVHAKRDSTGICFIGERRLRDFLAKWLPPKAGEIRLEDGRVIGEHHGAQYYTLGQRQGLGIGGVRGAQEAPWYVISKDMQENIIFVSQNQNHTALTSTQVEVDDLTWISGKAPADTVLSAKIRYRQDDQDCRLEMISDNRARVHFQTPQWAATPGQSLVLYARDVCLGGGIIESSNAQPITS